MIKRGMPSNTLQNLEIILWLIFHHFKNTELVN